jgi:hypothetical protein
MLKIPYLSFTKREVHLEGGRESSHDLLREGIKAYYLFKLTKNLQLEISISRKIT